MAGRSLNGRLDALELKTDPSMSKPVIIVVGTDESKDEARERWEKQNGPLDPRALVVMIDTGVHRVEGGICA